MFRFLCVTAHPDDEVGGFGGSLRLYASRGVEVSVICLTAGTAASNRGGAASDAELAAMRRKEFATACEMLKVSHGEVWDLPDGALDRVNFYDDSGTAHASRTRIETTRNPDPGHGRSSHGASGSLDGFLVRDHGISLGWQDESFSGACRRCARSSSHAKALLCDREFHVTGPAASRDATNHYHHRYRRLPGRRDRRVSRAYQPESVAAALRKSDARARMARTISLGSMLGVPRDRPDRNGSARRSGGIAPRG